MAYRAHKNPSRNHKRQSRKKRTGFRLFIRRLIMLGLVLFILFVVWVAMVARSLPDPERLQDRQVGETTKIYDRTGETLLFEIFSERKRTLIELTDVPDYAINATLAIEDKNFYEHRGVAYKSILRAAASNLLGRKTGRGGASTLTQQLIKNAIVGNERTLTRKLKEAILAIQLERRYTKDQILKLYFNEIPYGSTNYGIEAAAQSYFGESASDITLSQAATLASLPQAPTRYLNDIEKLTERRDYVLDLMVNQGHVTKEEATSAKKDEVEILYTIGNNIKAPHFIMMIKEQLTETFGEKLVEQGGLTITTTLDWDLQQIADEELKKGVEKNRENNKAENAALVAIDVKTGEVRAMVGSRNFFDEEYDGQVNVALRPRQPGSSFKPVVYAAGFEKGYTPDTILYDVETQFSTTQKTYSPKNYDLKERGPVTVRSALQGSLNIPAVKMLYLTGVDNTLNLAEKLGYTTLSDRSRFGLSLVLGGGEVTLLEHTTSFGTFARNGEYLPSTSILKVESGDGEVIFEHKPIKTKKVLDEKVVATLTNVLSDNNARAEFFGASSLLQLGDRPVAAKTGTTNDYRDGWLLGYTPSFVTGVWAGNNDNTPMNRGSGGSVAAGPIWNAFMKRALEGTPIETFPEAPKIETNKPVLSGVDPGKVEVEIDKLSGKLATEFTPDETREKKTYFVGHSILYHISKDDPQGNPPGNPTDDPQFAKWEEAILTWATKPKEGDEIDVVVEIAEPPTEYDDIHLPHLQPSIRLIEPSRRATVGRKMPVSIEADAPRGVFRAKYFVDGIEVGESTNAPNFEMVLDLGSFVTGFHTFTAKAYDDLWNTRAAAVDINITGQANQPTTSFTYPPQGIILTENDFPLALEFKVTQPSRINEVALYIRKSNEGFRNDLMTFDENITHNMSYTLETPPEDGGNYVVTTEITYDTNKTTSSNLTFFLTK